MSTLMPRQLGAEVLGELQHDPAAEAAARAFAQTYSGPFFTTKLDEGPFAFYVYADGEGNAFMGADLIQNPSFDPDNAHEPAGPA